MLETLQLALPRMQKYERELPVTDVLEEAMFDMYSEIIVFCAHAIAAFCNNPNMKRNPHAWSRFSREFFDVMADFQRCSRRVDEAADMIRLSREKQTAETVAALSRNLKDIQVSNEDAKLPCHTIPYGLNLRSLDVRPSWPI